MEHWADYVVFVLFLCISLGIGLYFAFTGGKQRTTSEFIMANRNLSVIPTMMSLSVSFISAITVIGYPAEMHQYGLLKCVLTLLHIVVGISVVGQLMVPWLYPLKLTSVFEYFTMRYPGVRSVKYFAACLGLVKILGYMGAVTFAPAVALESATGLSTEWCIAILGGLCTLYTTLGGLKAVIWTDVFQTVVMLGGMVFIVVKSWLLVGGFGRAIELGAENHRMDWHNFDFDPTTRATFWGFTIGAIVNNTSLSLSQAIVQRYSAVRSLTASKMTMITAIPTKCILTGLSIMYGMLIVAYYAQERCDPVASGEVSSANQILSLFVKESFRDYPGFSGLFMATLSSGALSSASSGLSGCAAICYKHLLQPNYPNMSDKMATKITKGLVFLFGGLSMGVTYLVALVPGPVMQVNSMFTAAASGPVLGLFLLGGVRPLRFVNGMDAFLGGVIGFGLNLWIVVGAMQLKGVWPPLPPLPTDNCVPSLNMTDIVQAQPVLVTGIRKIHTISFTWYTSCGAGFTIMFAVLIALLTRCFVKREIGSIPEKLFINFRNIYRLIPVTCEDEDEKVVVSKETRLIPVTCEDEDEKVAVSKETRLVPVTCEDEDEKVVVSKDTSL